MTRHFVFLSNLVTQCFMFSTLIRIHESCVNENDFFLFEFIRFINCLAEILYCLLLVVLAMSSTRLSLFVSYPYVWPCPSPLDNLDLLVVPIQMQYYHHQVKPQTQNLILGYRQSWHPKQKPNTPSCYLSLLFWGLDDHTL